MTDIDHGFVYIASPYSHPDKAVRQKRYDAVASYVANGLLQRRVLYSPIVHHHYLATVYNMPNDWGFWRYVDGNMLCAAASMEVVCLDGWDTSIGVQAEIGIAMGRGLPIKFINHQGKEVYVP
jgi:Domain of unknown function (DUF1937)